MHKNIGIIILTLILAVVSYCYISAHYRISDLQKQLNEHNSGAKSRITLYEEDRIFYHLLSDDNKLWLLFTYDNQGLKETFGLVDDLSEKKIGFNFTEKGELTSFSYVDNQYSIMTNVNAYPETHDKLIEREEWINGLGIFYTLSSDGNSESKRLYYDDTGIIKLE
jgi:hypothetical protein